MRFQKIMHAFLFILFDRSHLTLTHQSLLVIGQTTCPYCPPQFPPVAATTERSRCGLPQHTGAVLCVPSGYPRARGRNEEQPR